MSPLIELTDVSKVYRMGDIQVPALQHVDLTIEEGDFVAVMGPSGSGKSTLMNILGTLDRPTSGRYLLDGVVVEDLDESVASLFSQDAEPEPEPEPAATAS